jgi:hypothetical protein
MPAASLPHWDLSVVFPALDSPEFEAGFQTVVSGTDRLAALFDERHVEAQPPAAFDPQQIETFELAAAQLNNLLDRLATLGANIAGFVSTNSRDELAQAKQSELRRHNVQLSNLDTRFTAWVGSLDVEALFARSALARDHAYMLAHLDERMSA